MNNSFTRTSATSDSTMIKCAFGHSSHQIAKISISSMFVHLYYEHSCFYHVYVKCFYEFYNHENCCDQYLSSYFELLVRRTSMLVLLFVWRRTALGILLLLFRLWLASVNQCQWLYIFQIKPIFFWILRLMQAVGVLLVIIRRILLRVSILCLSLLFRRHITSTDYECYILPSIISYHYYQECFLFFLTSTTAIAMLLLFWAYECDIEYNDEFRDNVHHYSYE